MVQLIMSKTLRICFHSNDCLACFHVANENNNSVVNQKEEQREGLRNYQAFE